MAYRLIRAGEIDLFWEQSTCFYFLADMSDEHETHDCEHTS